MSKIFYHIILNTSQTQADAVTGILYSHSCLGLEETDNKDSVQLKAYFPNQKKRIDALSAELKKKFPNLTTEISTVDMASLQFQPKPFEPIEIAPSIWVVPPADLETTGGVARSVACGVLLGAPTGTRRDRTRSCPHITITIRPGMAFGTGRHESSQLCAQAICEIKNPQSKTLLDVGTGSGILVILAHQRGFKKVDAVEIDPDARQNTLENFELNKIHDVKVDGITIGGWTTAMWMRPGMRDYEAKNVVAIGGPVVLSRTAVVGGNVVSLGGVIVMARDAEVGGSLTEINSSNLYDTLTTALSAEWEGWSWIFAVISLAIFLVIIVLALLIVALLPKPVRVVADAISAVRDCVSDSIDERAD